MNTGEEMKRKYYDNDRASNKIIRIPFISYVNVKLIDLSGGNDVTNLLTKR